MTQTLPVGIAATAEGRIAALRNRIAGACHAIRVASIAWAVWTLAMIVYVYADRDALAARLSREYSIEPTSFSPAGYWAAFAVVLVDWSVTVLLVLAVWRLTRGYLGGEFFAADAARRLRAVGLVGFLVIGVDIGARPLQYMLLSPDLPGRLPLYAWLQPQDLLYAIICGFLLALAVIFGSAAEIAEDNAQFV